jgi:glycosyltransferase involved in cell wall biosynthesis
VNEKTPGQMHARRTGAAHAKYTFMSFLDDDNRATENWIQIVFETLSSGNADAAGGLILPEFETEKPIWFDEFAHIFAVGKQGGNAGLVNSTRGFLWGAGFSIKKSVWEELLHNGFPGIQSGRKGKNLTAGEDSEIGLSLCLLGKKLYYEPKLVLYHYMPNSRMKIEMLFKLLYGMGHDEVVLSMYRSILFPSFRIKNTWWLEYMAAVKHLSLFLLRKLPQCFSHSITFKASLKYRLGYLSGIVDRKKDYSKMLNQIRLFSRRKA